MVFVKEENLLENQNQTNLTLMQIIVQCLEKKKQKKKNNNKIFLVSNAHLLNFYFFFSNVGR